MSTCADLSLILLSGSYSLVLTCVRYWSRCHVHLWIESYETFADFSPILFSGPCSLVLTCVRYYYFQGHAHLWVSVMFSGVRFKTYCSFFYWDLCWLVSDTVFGAMPTCADVSPILFSGPRPLVSVTTVLSQVTTYVKQNPTFHFFFTLLSSDDLNKIIFRCFLRTQSVPLVRMRGGGG